MNTTHSDVYRRMRVIGMSTERLSNLKPVHFKEDEKGNKFVLLSEDDYWFLRELAERVQEIEHDKERLELIKERQKEEYRKIYEQNYRYREAIIDAMDLGLYGDSDSGIMTMYKILNEALKESQ